MTAFASKASPTSAKLRGGYYTPEPIAAFLAQWVAPAGDHLLEPSCGDGAMLAPMARLASEVVGVELEPDEARVAATAAPGATVVQDDFFEWFERDQRGRWDGVAGNPPFIRYQNWVEPTREKAFEVMRSAGMRPTKLTNAWVPFIVASALALRRGGRLGLVVPAELLQVKYAAELRAFLVDEFEDLTAIAFDRLVFDGVLQEVVLLLGVRGKGPAKIRVVEAPDTAAIPSATDLASLPHAPALRHDHEKWTKYFLAPKTITTLRRVRKSLALRRLGDIVDVDVGVVTGRNQFFVLRPSSTEDRDLQRFVVPLVSKSAHVRGVKLTRKDYNALEREDALCHLLAIDNEVDPDEHEALRLYIGDGESQEVHTGYKCSIRKKWWAVPSIWTPDAFLLRQIYDHPRVIANLAGATATDTIHRIRMLNGISPAALAAASINSATFAFSETMGRSYGGGVLELEPREAEDLPFPDPSLLDGKTVAKVDALVRQGDLLAALDLVDGELLAPHFEEDVILRLRRTWQRLRDRRLARGKKPAATRPTARRSTASV